MNPATNDASRNVGINLDDLVALPPPRHDFDAVARLVAAMPVKVVVLDDDPTGTQTVHGIDVLTEWSETALAGALTDPRPAFFVLTNSRSLPEAEAVALTRTLATNLRAAARATGHRYTIISRSDSTLRGHFPAEIDALDQGGAQRHDAVIVAPAFFEAGRMTMGDTHYVREGQRLVPAAETEFAHDATFGYRSSNLREWIEEKTGGRVSAGSVASICLPTLRQRAGANAVRDHLLRLSRGSYVVVNAADYGDLEVFVHGLLLAEAAGRRYLCRTAASFVRVRAGIAPQPLLDPAALRGTGAAGGLVVVGSYTAKTTLQLVTVLARVETLSLELVLDQLVRPEGEAAELSGLKAQVEPALRQGRTVVVYTSRGRETALGRAGDLNAGRIVSEALVKLVRSLEVRPRFLIAKGGITSSDIAVQALGVRRARILGQAEPGIPVWQTGPESRWPGLAYVVFPGNVGEAGALDALNRKLGG
jgi:uncharacterized protein YgbK (DUF1537 family)